MIIVPATPFDVPGVANILSCWNASTDWMPRLHTRASEKGFAQMLVGNGWTTVARDGERLLGFLARDRHSVHALYVAPHLRGKGVGKALLDQAKQASDILTLYTFQHNEGAQRFYLREGFSEVFCTDGAGNDEGLPDICYEWRRA